MSFRLLLAIPVIVLAAATTALGCTVTGWRGSGAGTLARIHQVTLLAGIVALVWFLRQWNLIGGSEAGAGLARRHRRRTWQSAAMIPAVGVFAVPGRREGLGLSDTHDCRVALLSGR